MKGKALTRRDVEKINIEDTETLNKIARFFRVTIPLAPAGKRSGPWTPVLCINRLKRPLKDNDFDRFADSEIYLYNYEQMPWVEERPRDFYTMVKDDEIRSLSPKLEL